MRFVRALAAGAARLPLMRLLTILTMLIAWLKKHGK